MSDTTTTSGVGLTDLSLDSLATSTLPAPPVPIQNPLTLILDILDPVTNYDPLYKAVVNLSRADLMTVPILHFVRLFFLTPQTFDTPAGPITVPTQMSIVNTFDGSLDDYLEAFVNAHDNIFEPILQYVDGASTFIPIVEHKAAIKAWLVAQNIAPNFWYSAYPTVTTPTIQKYVSDAGVVVPVNPPNIDLGFGPQTPLTIIADILSDPNDPSILINNYNTLVGLCQQLHASDLNTVLVIHFARFFFFDFKTFLTPGGPVKAATKFAVFTAYDGNFDNYIEDFIHETEDIFDAIVPSIQGATGFSPINKNAEPFKAWLKTKDADIAFWFSAYPTITLIQIEASEAANNKQ